ncbi:MAG: succinylglutamate desuccinylase/aspartoacylase family protein [Methanobrevibacter sp.]|nr:succinylglutamate desuccinylase/aspartoacylase family protein [Methanobrevibacter sp.]
MFIKTNKLIKIIILSLLLISIFLVAIQISSAATITVEKWGTGGEITKNKVLSKELPKTNLTRQVLKAAKKGTPVVKFGNGEGPVTIMVAGVHGNELSSQVAAMRLINNLNKRKKINGTIYVMPFVTPKGSSLNIRTHNGRNLNTIANKKGSITNNIVKYAIDKKVTVAGDFHCTRPRGNPGRTVIMGNEFPDSRSSKMAIAISKLTGHGYKNGKIAGTEYPGALEDVLTLKSIPAVTCEVKTPHGKIAKGSVKQSYRQMIFFLRYNGFIK